jgi:hypothetical protein
MAMRQVLLASLLLAFTAGALAATKPIVWKPARNAFLHVNDQPVKDWDAFEIEKKSDRYLLKLEGKYLFLDTQQKNVFELSENTLQRQGSDLLWDPDTLPEKPMGTSNWIVRDVGLALRIRFHLNQDGRDIDLQIPHKRSR